jgi:hypothetical protein
MVSPKQNRTQLSFDSILQKELKGSVFSLERLISEEESSSVISSLKEQSSFSSLYQGRRRESRVSSISTLERSLPKMESPCYSIKVFKMWLSQGKNLESKALLVELVQCELRTQWDSVSHSLLCTKRLFVVHLFSLEFSLLTITIIESPQKIPSSNATPTERCFKKTRSSSSASSIHFHGFSSLPQILSRMPRFDGLWVTKAKDDALTSQIEMQRECYSRKDWLGIMAHSRKHITL